jgi:hypothetical protein
MRLIIGVLACVSAGGLSPALADPPAADSASSPAASAPAPVAAAPAENTPAAPAATSASAAPQQAGQLTAKTPDAKATVIVQGTPEFDVLEKHFLAEGYRLEMHKGEKMFCRREEELGSRLGSQKVCSTAQQLMFTERDAQRSVDRVMMQQNNPTGR